MLSSNPSKKRLLKKRPPPRPVRENSPPREAEAKRPQEWSTPLVHAGFRFRVPKGWMDHSVISFVSPVQQQQASTVAGKQSPSFVSNLRVEFIDAKRGPPTPDAYLDEMMRALKVRGRESSEVRRFDLSIAGYPGRALECSIMLEKQVVRQLQAVAKVGAVWVLAMGSTPEMSRKESLPVLQEMIEGIELTQGRG